MNPEDCTHPAAAQQYDRVRGTVTCSLCGSVVTESHFELDPAFTQERSHGPTTMAMRQPGFTRMLRVTQPQPAGSHRQSIESARRSLVTIARQLQIPQDHVEVAAGVYKVALNNNAIVGARPPVLCACLYIVCRRKGTPHLIADFTDISGESPFTILHYLRVVCEATHTAVPPVDPSFYVYRLAQQLEVGSKIDDVCLCAVKILRAMKDDWIHTGRRPLGPCAAALLVACNTFGIPRTPEQVVSLVRLSAGTITKRIDEFLATPTASLASIDDYSPSDATNPEAFTKGRKRDDAYRRNGETLEIVALYWELVNDATDAALPTPERCAKWLKFWAARRALGLSVDLDEIVPPLDSLSPTDQLRILGLPKERAVVSRSADLETQRAAYSALLSLKELKTLDDDQQQRPVTQQQRQPLTLPSGAAFDPTREDITLPPMEDDAIDELVQEYLIMDLDTRLRRQQANEKAFPSEVWSRGGPAAAPVKDIEELTREEVANRMKRKRKMINESRTATEAVAQVLKNRGAGQVVVENIDLLLARDTGGEDPNEDARSDQDVE